jgi:GNAT superfamily N-acetyltransferase
MERSLAVRDRDAIGGPPVGSATAADARAVVTSCSGASLGRRFWIAKDLPAPEALARYATYLLPGVGRPAWVVRRAGRPVGLLNVTVLGADEAEAAVLVADPWQGQGVASQLVSTVFGGPAWAGWRLRAVVQPDDEAARRLLGHVAPGRPRLAAVGPGELEFLLDVPDGG